MKTYTIDELKQWLFPTGPQPGTEDLGTLILTHDAQLEKEVESRRNDLKCKPGAASITCAFCDKQASFIIRRTATCEEHRGQA